MEHWDKVSTENLMELADTEGYLDDFYKMFGFHFDNVDYEEDISLVQVIYFIFLIECKNAVPV